MSNENANRKFEKRTTRTYLHTVEDRKYFEENFIDNFYSKKKKPAGMCKNDFLFLHC